MSYFAEDFNIEYLNMIGTDYFVNNFFNMFGILWILLETVFIIIKLMTKNKLWGKK